jgi:alpha-glucosidase
VFARKDRNSEDWYLGGLTDENARIVPVSTDFLSADKNYQMQVYQDGEKADWETHPNEIEIFSKPVKKGEKLKLRMAKSGGIAIRFRAL